jgi:hypothetical protein
LSVQNYRLKDKQFITWLQVKDDAGEKDENIVSQNEDKISCNVKNDISHVENNSALQNSQNQCENEEMGLASNTDASKNHSKSPKCSDTKVSVEESNRHQSHQVVSYLTIQLLHF